MAKRPTYHIENLDDTSDLNQIEDGFNSISKTRTNYAATVKESNLEKERLAKYRSSVRENVAFCNRDKARVYASKQRERRILKNVVDLGQKIRDTELQESKANVIKQTIELEKAANKIKLIPGNEWPNFVQDIKKTRKIWHDFGFDEQDVSSIDKEMEKRRAVSDAIMERLKDPKNYFTTIPLAASLNKKKKKGGFFKPCEYCHEFIPSDTFEAHVAKCSIELRKPVPTLVYLDPKAKPPPSTYVDETENYNSQNEEPIVKNDVKKLKSVLKYGDMWCSERKAKGYPVTMDFKKKSTVVFQDEPPSMALGRRLTPVAPPKFNDLINSLRSQKCLGYSVWENARRADNGPNYGQWRNPGSNGSRETTTGYIFDSPKRR